jgi:hypothetical protein
MRRPFACLAACAVVSAGCGQQARPTESPDTRSLQAHGLAVELPPRWSGRILLGADARPVLHAANFPLPPSDDDSGGLAQETIGSRGQLYVNVREGGNGGSPLPVSFAASEFEHPGPEDRCCFVLVARREVMAAGRSHRVTVTSGSEQPPPESALAEANALLATLEIEPVPVDAPLTLPAHGRAIDGYGISMRLPNGWKGHVERGRVEAFSPELRLQLLERGVIDASFAARRFPVRLSTAEFVAPSGGLDPAIPAMTGGSFVSAGRQFVFSAEADALPPSAQAVEQANRALGSLRVQPGDFYPGVVHPATFEEAAGWDTGASPPATQEPEGQQTWTWASTSPYLDTPPQSLPVQTLERLPPDGIVIRVALFGPDAAGAGSARPPFRIAQATRSYSWEGQIDDVPLFSIAGRAPDQEYNVDITVFFGRPHPTRSQIARANAELERLRLPDWSFPGHPGG